MPENLPALRGRSIGGVGIRVPRREDEETFDLMDLDVVERSFVEKPAVPGAVTFLVKSMADKAETERGQDGAESVNVVQEQDMEVTGMSDQNTDQVVEPEMDTMPEAEAVEQEADVTKSEVVGAQAEPAADGEEMIAKSVVMEMIDKAVAPLQDRVAKAEAEAFAEREKRRDAEMVQKARGFRAIGTPTDQLAKVLKTAYDVSPEYGAELEAILHTNDKALHAAGIFEEIGKAGEDEPTANDFLSKIERRAKEIVAAEGLQYAEAYTKAYKEAGQTNADEARSHIRTVQRQTMGG